MLPVLMVLYRISNEITLTVNALPTITVSPTSGSFCTPGGAAVTLTASNGVSYSWLPATGLKTATGSTVNANPSATTTYTVTGTDANGCTNTATAAITVAEKPSLTATATPVNICSGANSQLLATAAITSLYAVSSTSFDYSQLQGLSTGLLVMMLLVVQLLCHSLLISLVFHTAVYL